MFRIENPVRSSRSANKRQLSSAVLTNAYIEQAPADGRSASVLLGCPGYRLLSTISSEKIRGFHKMLSTGALFVVCGKGLFEILSTGQPIQRGTIPGYGRVGMADNGTQLCIVTGALGYIYTDLNGLAQISDIDFQGATTVDVLNGFFIFNSVRPGREDRYFISSLLDGEAYDSLEYASAERRPDKILRVFEDHSELLLFGTDTIDTHFPAGGDFPFSASPSAGIDQGLGARWSIEKIDESVVWLDNEGIVRRLQGRTPVRISTHAVEDAIAAASAADAYSWSYVDGGHQFYVLTIPAMSTAQTASTWIWDAATGEWHNRKSAGLDYFRVGFYARAHGKHIVGDSLTGNIYELSTDFFVEHDDEMVYQITFPQVGNAVDRFIVHRMEIDMEKGGDRYRDIITRGLGDWTQQTSGTAEDLHAVATGNGIMIVAGNNATTLRSSDNGSTWVPKTSQFTADNINGVAFANGKFVQVGENGKRSYSTNTGTTWIASHDATVAASELDQKYLSASAGVNTETLAIVGDYIYVLEDGASTPDLFRYNKADGTLESTVATNVTLFSSGNADVMTYNPDDGLLYAIGGGVRLATMALAGTDGTDYGTIPGYTSDDAYAGLIYLDGFFYTLRNRSPYVGSNTHFVEKRTADTNFTLVQSWEYTSLVNGMDDPDSGNLGPILDQSTPRVIGYDPINAYFLIAGWEGSTSSHGVAALDLSDATAVYVYYKWRLETATNVNGTTLVFDIPNNLFYKADRNTTFHAHYWADQAPADYNAVHGNGDYFVAVGDAVGGAGIIDYAADPASASWSRVDSDEHPFTGNLYTVTYGNDLWLAAGAGGKLATASTLGSWTERTSSFGATAIYGIGFGPGYFVAVGGAGKVAKSLDGRTWTQQTSPFNASYIVAAVTWNGSLWVATSFSGEMATSPDGETWTLVTSSFSATEVSGVAFLGSVGVASGHDGKIATTSIVETTSRVKTEDPQVSLSVSKDGGRLFDGPQQARSMGKQGEARQRIHWDQLGQYESFTPRLTITAPVRRAVYSAFVDLEQCR